jgi:hypothetical protein
MRNLRNYTEGRIDRDEYNRVDNQITTGGVIGIGVGAALLAAAALAPETIAFGLSREAARHAWRHVITRGLSPAAVRRMILRDARTIARRLQPGNTMTRVVRVDGRQIEYRIHRLADGRLNIGSIRPPRP